MKVYHGIRTPKGAVVTVLYENGNMWPLDPRFDLRRHSPDGFEWGYGGSGGAQLSLALLADALEGRDDLAQTYYQDFKDDHVATIPGDRWMMAQEDVLAAVAGYASAKDA